MVPGRPKARVRWPTSADTAHAPKNMIRAMTTASTIENVSGTGMRLDLVNLILVSGYTIPLIENLINLDKLVGKEFELWALPLKLKGGDGAATRAVARIL